MSKNIIDNFFKQSLVNKSDVETYPFRDYLKQLNEKIRCVLDRQKSLILIFIDIKEFHKIERLQIGRAHV